MTRGKRIAVELLGPPALGATLFASATMAASWGEGLMTGHLPQWSWNTLGVFGMMLAVAYIFAGVQSIIYTVIMEWSFSRGLDPRSWLTVGLSTLLGFASGAAICLAYGFHRADVFFLWLYFGGIGLAVGFVLGVLIKMLSEKTVSGG